MIFAAHVCVEPLKQLDWCLQALRKSHHNQPVLIINDGSPIDYSHICKKYDVNYYKCEQLKTLDHGAKWWNRFFVKSLSFANPETQFIFKFDPDTMFHRKFSNYPDYDVSGTIQGGSIQGGFQCFKVSAVKKIIESEICLDDRFKAVGYWAPNDFVRKYFLSQNKACMNWMLTKIIKKLSLTKGNWHEVHSCSFVTQFRKCAAVTHPHKNDWQTIS